MFAPKRTTAALRAAALPGEPRFRNLYAHRPSNPLRLREPPSAESGGRRERLGVALPADENPGRGHRPGNNAEHAFARRCCAFAVDDQLALDAVDDMFLLPGKVVVILDIEQHLRAEIFGD